MSSAPLTVRLPQEVKARLARLSAMTGRTSSFLVAEAISAYVARETEAVDGIKRGLADMKAWRLVPHADAAADIASLIDEVQRSRE